MTVAELIRELQAMPQELPVYWDNSDGMNAEAICSLSHSEVRRDIYDSTLDQTGHYNHKWIRAEGIDAVLLSWRVANIIADDDDAR